MNVWLIQSGEPAPLKDDIRKMRTALLADVLVERGHSVYWWSSAFEHQRKIWLSEKDREFHFSPQLTLRVIRGCGYRGNISIARYIDHKIVATKFKMQSRRVNKPDIVVTSMPCHQLAYESMLYARLNRVPLVVDIRDLWPDTFLGPLQKARLYKLGRIALALDFAKLSYLLQEADSLVAMSQGCLDWGLNKIGRPQGRWDKVFYHGYKNRLKNADLGDFDYLDKFKNKQVFVFVGTFGDSYELRLILEVARRFKGNGKKDLLFFLAGTGEQYERLKAEVADLPNVLLPGWIEASDIEKALFSSWAGIVPCNSVKNAAPNKVFEYLSAGLPLISSLEGEMADLIEHHAMGLNYRPGDAEGLYNCIQKLSTNSGLRSKMAANASRFYEEFGDADRIYAEYAEHVEKVFEHRKSRKS
jgi:glycosyltransferase involved in cell wall biosynthesis